MNKTSAPTSAAAVANKFLALGERDASPIDQMKLQKLLFYAHAWYLAIKGVPLFDEDFQAWAWGPVIPDIYNETRRYGRNPVTGRVSHLERIGHDPLKWRFLIPAEIQDDEINSFLDEVWKTHKAFTGIQLSNSTHGDGEPWTIVREQYGTLEHKPNIPNELIKSVFLSKLANNASKNSST